MSLSEIYWTEKYRPDTLDEVIGNDQIVANLKTWAETGELPNILLAGPAGVGKTALAVAFAKDYYGDDWRQNFMELNASDDRGIQVVRDQIKGYAEQSVMGDHEFSIIFLDEADSLTKDAQAALRRVMEDYAGDTRFILSCNFKNKLIDPIQSRCTPYQVSPLSNQEVGQILRRVVDGEDLEYDDGVLSLIVEAANGDARKAINTLQAAVTGDRVEKDSIQGVVSPVDEGALQEVVEAAIGGDLADARGRMNEEFLKEGIDPATIAAEMMRVIDRVEMPEHARGLAMDAIGEFEYRCLEGANPHVQASACLGKLQVARHVQFPNYD